MAKAFRFSGYLVEDTGKTESFSKEDFKRVLKEKIDKILQDERHEWQQLHIEESESFKLDGEDEPNCDLALLTRHFKKSATGRQFDRALPVAGQKYRHFKLGKIVTVIGISRHTETEEVTVVYQYEDSIWNRPIEMFMSEVDREKYPDAEQKYRFELIEEKVSE